MRSFLLLSASISVVAFANMANAQSTVGRTVPAPVSLPAPGTPEVTIQNINPGQTINSNMSASDVKLSADGSPIEIYKVRVRTGQRVIATMRSTAFKSVLNIGDIQDGGDCEDCNSGTQEENNPAIARYTAKADGYVYIRTNTMEATDTGAYSLNVTVADAPRVTYAPLTFGRLVQGRLIDGDALNDEGKNTDNYSLNLPANQRIQIDLTSEAFDPIATLNGPNKERAIVELAKDDDAGPGTNARIRFTTEAAGVYKINVAPVGDEAVGAYSLLVGAVPPRAPLAPPRQIGLGATLSSNLPTTGAKEEIDGEDVITQRFRFVAAAGQTYAIDTKSSAFDVITEVGNYKADGEFEVATSDDDGGDGTNSLVRFKAEKPGPYIIRVHEILTAAEGQEETDVPMKPKGGAYTLSLNTAVIAPAPSAGLPIVLGQTIDGELKDGGPRRDDDTLYNVYSINLTKGQKVTVEMKANGPEEGEKLDSFLEIGTGTPANFTKSSEDDDGGKELNAKIKFEAPETGSYLIRATTIGAGNKGLYKLSVINTPPPAPAPTPIAIGVGTNKDGALVETDAIHGDDEAHYKLYSFNAEANATYIIELESTDFDPIVYAKAAGANDETYKSDDDSGGGEDSLNAKLEFMVENAGPQTIRVSAVASDGLGKYKLKLSRK